MLVSVKGEVFWLIVLFERDEEVVWVFFGEVG